jgi:hypothetical protein
MNERKHDISAAGAGDLGVVPAGDPVGPCPSCGEPLRAIKIEHPHSGRMTRALAHPVPFCSYFGETSADEIERAIASKP